MPAGKIIIYQLLVRLFGNKKTPVKPHGTIAENGVGKFADINPKALSELKRMGITHLWLTGIIRQAGLSDFTAFNISVNHPEVVKGLAGSPYAITDYYDVAPELATDVNNRIAEFKELVNRIHEAGMKVIIDFVPNHVAREYKSIVNKDGKNFGDTDNVEMAFSAQNNYYYLPNQAYQSPAGLKPLSLSYAPEGEYREFPARATGNDCFKAQPAITDWFETVKLNYGVDYATGEKHFDPIPDTWFKMADILKYWAQMGVDGFRTDMAEMVPVEFWNWALPQVKNTNEALIFIAEVYNPQLYEDYLVKGNFDYLYDKTGLYDLVYQLTRDGGSANHISTLLMQQAGHTNQMLRFMENHDEIRVASRLFAGSPWLAVPGFTLSGTLGNGPLMIYFGQEVGEPAAGSEGFSGEDGKTTIFDYWAVPELQKWVNGGKFDGSLLSNDHLQLRAFYARLSRTLVNNPAFYEGDFYNLQYANTGCSWDYDDNKVFTFLRFTETDRFLVFINFDRNRRNMEPRIKIPREAWEKMGLPADADYKLTDLLLTRHTYRFHAADTTNLYNVMAGVRVAVAPSWAYIFRLEPDLH